MILRAKYNGLCIDAVSRQLTDGLGWSSSFYIEEEDGAGSTVTEFLTRHFFPTEEAAIRSAIFAAQRKIDLGFSANSIRATS